MRLLVMGASDSPVCGVRDYNRVLQTALGQLGVEVETTWLERDSRAGLRAMISETRAWSARVRSAVTHLRPDWVLWHYVPMDVRVSWRAVSRSLRDPSPRPERPSLGPAAARIDIPVGSARLEGRCLRGDYPGGFGWSPSGVLRCRGHDRGAPEVARAVPVDTAPPCGVDSGLLEHPGDESRSPGIVG